MARGKTWTKEEIDYLLDRWGEVSVKGIADRLGRSISAVRQKGYRIGLGKPTDHMDGVLVHQFAKETGISYSTIMWWIKNKKFPAKQKTLVEEEKYWYVNIDDFWKWAEKNKELINFAEFEEYILGAEPEWVKEMRKRDRKNIVKINSNKKFWTDSEDRRLKFLVEQQKYTSTDIARKLGRSEAAIRRRIYDLDIGIRPKRSKHKLWTDREIEILVEMNNKGYGHCIIADKLGRTEHSIRGKLERLQKEA